MPVNRFFIDVDFQRDTSVTLLEKEAHHLIHVLRQSVGDVVELVNGRGDLAHGKILDLPKKKVLIQILEHRHEEMQGKQIFLACPFMRPSKLEWIVEKGTELGAAGFLFYRAEGSEKIEITSRHLERFFLLGISSLKQSGRLYAPSFTILPSLETLLQRKAFFLYGDPCAKIKISEMMQFQELTAIFMTGPEKGFSPYEMTLLQQQAVGVLLNPFCLRAETAPIAAMSILATGWL